MLFPSLSDRHPSNPYVSKKVVSTMQILEGVFSGSYAKKDGSIPAPSADLQALHCAALSSWSLLLTLLTSGDVFRIATTQVSILSIFYTDFKNTSYV